MSAKSACVLQVIIGSLVIGFVLLLMPSPDFARAGYKNRDLIRASGQRSIEQVRSLPYTNGKVPAVAESDQTAEGTEESKERKNTRTPWSP